MGRTGRRVLNGYLLDTHALLWWMSANPMLPSKARSAIEAGDTPVFASPINAYEIAQKHRLGKLEIAASILPSYESDLARIGLLQLPLTAEHALRAGSLGIAHRDPFDRMLIAQAQIEGLTVITNERLFELSGVDRLWD